MKLKKVSYVYSEGDAFEKKALDEISLEIPDGQFIGIIGHTGSGKSTLIRCINLLESPTSGEIWVDDQCITDKKCNLNKVRQKMGMVFQSFNLFGHMNVIENIMAAREFCLKSRSSRRMTTECACCAL